MGPAPPAIYPAQQAAEVYFATVGQAAAALTALNAIVVPALSGRQQLEIRCWVQPKGAAAAQAHGRQARTPQAAGRLQQAQQAQHGIVSLQGPTQHALSAGPSEPAAAKGPSLELPGVTDLPAALDFCSSCCYKAVPGEPPVVAPRQLCWLPLAAACRAAAGPPGQARTARHRHIAPALADHANLGQPWLAQLCTALPPAAAVCPHNAAGCDATP